ncbi:MAG: metal ABC transporter ATP-binding protein [Chloroflexi bacterium]|nr:metal ABC transporter ATP-binding protein [Chloroflexota bacterium]
MSTSHRLVATGTPDSTQQEPIIQLRNVTVAYEDQVVLEDVTFTVYPGMFVAIIGPNGAGKTTLIRTILGLIKPLRGEVLVFGKPAWELKEERKRLGYVPQILSVDLHFPITAGEVVLMGRYARVGLIRRPSKEDYRIARASMERVGVGHLWDRPFGKLSGGQRQRVLIARALANEPDLLVLDEPTTGVDVTATQTVYSLLREFHEEGMTILVVSHDVGVVATFVDTVACVNRRLVAHGRPEEVLGSEELARMYGCDVAYFHHGRVPHLVVEPADGEKSD